MIVSFSFLRGFIFHSLYKLKKFLSRGFYFSHKKYPTLYVSSAEEKERIFFISVFSNPVTPVFFKCLKTSIGELKFSINISLSFLYF